MVSLIPGPLQNLFTANIFALGAREPETSFANLPPAELLPRLLGTEPDAETSMRLETGPLKRSLDYYRLVETVRKNPDDGPARAVLKDWLLENDPIRGELIRLGQSGMEVRKKELERQLKQKNRARSESIVEGVLHWKDGYVEAASFSNPSLSSLRTFLETEEAALVGSLQLYSLTDSFVRDFAPLPHLRYLASLTLQGSWLSEEDVLGLTRSASLRSLKRLDLEFDQLGDPVPTPFAIEEAMVAKERIRGWAHTNGTQVHWSISGLRGGQSSL